MFVLANKTEFFGGTSTSSKLKPGALNFFGLNNEIDFLLFILISTPL